MRTDCGVAVVSIDQDVVRHHIEHLYDVVAIIGTEIVSVDETVGGLSSCCCKGGTTDDLLPSLPFLSWANENLGPTIFAVHVLIPCIAATKVNIDMAARRRIARRNSLGLWSRRDMTAYITGQSPSEGIRPLSGLFVHWTASHTRSVRVRWRHLSPLTRLGHGSLCCSRGAASAA